MTKSSGNRFDRGPFAEVQFYFNVNFIDLAYTELSPQPEGGSYAV
jgi:hypothetical protein